MTPVFPTVYFGNLAYYRSLFSLEEIKIESKEHFIKQTFRNRCEILTSNGVQQLSIPVIRKNGSKTVIEEIEISNDTDWRKDHWKAIESAYSNSPYFEHYGNEVKELIYQNETNLLKFNLNIQSRIFSWFQIDIKTSFSLDYIIQNVDQRVLLNQNRLLTLKDTKTYIQVFGDLSDFTSNLSILDALFCQGPMTRKILMES